jgi:uncharacterized repeat protein (TIGR03803 family)
MKPRRMTTRTVIVALALIIMSLAGRGQALADASESVLWNFGGGDDGIFPYAGSLVADGRGNFYGTTFGGGTNRVGTVFELTPAPGQTQWSERVLWSFGGDNDGAIPWAGLIADGLGNLYGTTTVGGANGAGTVFELTPPAHGQKQWSERVLWSFGGDDDGVSPRAGLLADGRGNLYGTTSGGGANGNYGTVFELTPPAHGQTQWSERVLWSFGNDDDGVAPWNASLIADGRGNLFGTTEAGGSNGAGTVFELTPPAPGQKQWSERLLWRFGDDDDGGYLQGGLIADGRGNLYGTTVSGGTNGDGTVFELTPPAPGQKQWIERVLWSFGDDDDGVSPIAGLIADGRGNLYGTTELGGENGNYGTVFELTPAARGQTQWSESVLWSFGDGQDGQHPYAGLVADGRGNLYGTTFVRGTRNAGVVFRVSP